MSPRYLPLLALLLLPGLAQAQADPSALREAALAGNAAGVERFVESKRLEVKPVVVELVGSIAEAVRQGNDAEIGALREAIGLIAKTFEETYGERSLTILSERIGSWSMEDLVVKAAADSLMAAGIEVRTQDREKAKADFEAALALYQELDDQNGLAEVTGQLGYVSWFLDRSTYVEQNEKALEARKAVDDRQLMGNSYNDLGLGNRLITRDYEAALAYYQEGERVRRAIGDSAALARMLPNLGRTYEEMGEYVKARDYYLAGAAFHLAVGDSANWIVQRRNTAGLMTNYAGRHTDALAILLDLRQDLALIEDARAEALVGLSLGIVRRRLGDYQGAVAEYQELLLLAEANGFDDILSQTLNNIGAVYIYLGRPDRATRFLERAYAAGVDNVDEPPTQALINLSSAHFQMRNYEEASEWLAKAQEIAVSRSLEASVVNMRADIQLRTGQEKEAQKGYSTLLAISNELEMPLLKSHAYFGMAEANERLEHADSALAYYELAAATLEEERGMLTAEEDKAGYLAQVRYLYEEIIHFLTREAIANPSGVYVAKAFEYAERGKARAFLDQMAESLAGVETGVDPEFQSDLGVLADNMAYLRGELATTDPAEADKVAELKANVRVMEAEYERVEREMRERNPRFAAIRYPNPITLDQVQNALLGQGELLLQYALGDSSSTLWAVTRESAEVFSLPVRSEIESQVELLRFALEAAGREYAAPASNLYATLVGPASELLEAASRVVIVPDGALNYVPFEALVSPDGSFLLDGAPVSYVQSASVLRQLRDEPASAPTKELLAVGDPAFSGALETTFLRGGQLARLPFSGAEVRSISSLFAPEETSVFLDEAATEEAVKAALSSSSYRFVHFATHGLVNDDRPDYSGLALAGEGTDALLQASEIFNMRVNADLVVLSACETGLGQLVKGEGMVGLTRAFMYAGAPSVAVSLWSVSDQSTSLLMQSLYGGLRDPAASKAASLRSAKLALLENSDTAHPFHWAPFVLVGRSE